MAEPRAFDLHSPRRGHTATLLDDGRVLLAGGAKPVTPERARVCDFDDPCTLASAELVDAEARTSALVTPMRVPREAHAAVAVPGGVLVVGGLFSGGACLRTPGAVEHFDVERGTWSDAAPLPGLIAPALAVLASGEILVSGGLGAGMPSAGSVGWDPADRVWRSRADLPRGRYLHAAVVLEDGRVLVAGGLGARPGGQLEALSSTCIYDARTRTWTETAPLIQARAEHTLTLLEDGSVLAIGGYGDEPAILASAELFRPANATWSALPSLTRARTGHTTTALGDGRALVVGGTGGSVDAPSPAWSDAELFDPDARAFTLAEARFAPRAGHTATRLPNGGVLVAGGGPRTARVWSA